MYDPGRGYPSVVPCVLYDDIPAAVQWLSVTLGFREMPTSITQVFVDDVEAACDLGGSAGGTLHDGPSDRPWGVRQAVLADPEGQHWLVTRHLEDTDPADWYGTVLGPMPG